MTLFQPDRFFTPADGGGADGLLLWNRFVAGAGEARPVGAGGVSLRYELAEAPAPQTWCVRLLLPEAMGSGAMLVCPRAFPFREIAGVELDASDLGALPAELRGAILLGMQGALARASGFGAGALPRIGEDGPLSALRDPALEWLAVTLEGVASAEVSAHVGARRGDLLRLLGAPGDGPMPQGALAGGLEVPVDLTAGRIDLTLAELRRIEPGDVAVLAAMPADQLHIRAGQFRFVFTQGEGGWTSSGALPIPRQRPRTLFGGLEAAQRQEDPVMSDQPADRETAPDTLSIEDLTLGVDFDLGRVAVPFSTLQSWTRGTVVPLSPPSTEPGVAVTIRINGDAVGTGDIVRIDDRIGVRITRLAAPTR
ncbi:FliM/FliN family flagellar motor switch protein [Aureimonas sp. AU4]|uniref:FliM/FliN family flagellar motor switch protein n=1 Tax=Aureimonas sp. AU4 TaxID=1638163 RepID=UPI0007825CCD|nr:FliM/FliN family flagellar motor switch protein [Aureimonas sp. AU4]